MSNSKLRHDEMQTKYFYHWAYGLPIKEKAFIKRLPKTNKAKMFRNTLKIWLASLRNSPELLPVLDAIITKWEASDLNAVYTSFTNRKREKANIRAERRSKQQKHRQPDQDACKLADFGLREIALIKPEQLGITPVRTDKEEYLDNSYNLSMACALRNNFAKDDKFVDMCFRLAKLAAEDKCHITVYFGTGLQGTFGSDNYGSLPHFCLIHWQPDVSAAVIIRRFEDGPVEPISKLPYKTIVALQYGGNIWRGLSEDITKHAMTFDLDTKEILPVEQAVLFDTITEIFPHLSDLISETIN